jgi:peptidylprolyl isomerase
LQSCGITKTATKPQAFELHESGIEYRITSRGDGEKPAINDLVKVHYTLMLEDSTVIDSSYERGEPASFKLGAGQVIKGWDIAIALLKEGDEAILRIPPELGYGNQPMGDIPANSLLLFDVKLIEVIAAPKPFAINSNVTVEETESGLKYTILDKGRGTKLQPGMKVKVHYSGFFEDMTMFDSSYERDEPVELTLGRGMVIKGWEEGLSYLRVGDKARLWIPHQLAYGEQGRGRIPSRADLIFDVEVIDAAERIKATPFDVMGKDTLVTQSGVKYIIVNSGRGDYPQSGDIVSVHYSGFLPDGTMFDSSVERDQPFRFVLGQNQVIPGWDQGIALNASQS